jgi:hypothetical protein
MDKEKLIPANELCQHYGIELSFISSLNQSGLLQITTIEERGYIQVEQLKDLEKIIHFYYDMDINLEGIETITYLLDRISNMQEELSNLRNRLRYYEMDDQV